MYIHQYDGDIVWKRWSGGDTFVIDHNLVIMSAGEVVNMISDIYMSILIYSRIVADDQIHCICVLLCTTDFISYYQKLMITGMECNGITIDTADIEHGEHDESSKISFLVKIVKWGYLYQFH